MIHLKIGIVNIFFKQFVIFNFSLCSLRLCMRKRWRNRSPPEYFGKLTRHYQIISLPGSDVAPARVGYI